MCPLVNGGRGVERRCVRGARSAAQHLTEREIERAELGALGLRGALARARVVAAGGVLLPRSRVRVPDRVCDRRLLREQQQESEAEGEDALFHDSTCACRAMLPRFVARAP